MRSGDFHILKRIQLFTDIGEHPLKIIFLNLNFEQCLQMKYQNFEIPVFSVIFAGLITKFNDENENK